MACSGPGPAQGQRSKAASAEPENQVKVKNQVEVNDVVSVVRPVIRPTALRPKFRRIFFTPGNNEMWITPLESQMFPDSLCKLWAILELCDRLGVEVAPAAVSEGVFVVPLFSWYNPEFDTEDPYPDTQFQHDKYAKWPMDANHQVWRYMLALNRDELKRPYHGTVLTFSHFVPRSSLPVSREYGGAKVSGCAELDDQIREARSSCHLYGHTFKNFSKEVEDVIYINCAHKSGGQDEPIPCVFNGERVCCDMGPRAMEHANVSIILLYFVGQHGQNEPCGCPNILLLQCMVHSKGSAEVLLQYLHKSQKPCERQGQSKGLEHTACCPESYAIPSRRIYWHPNQLIIGKATFLPKLIPADIME
eukprot:s209_g24.t1